MINRHIYWIATLDDPLSPVSNPWASDGRKPGARWNEKLVYFFGGGCGYGYHQGTESASTLLIDDFLKLGYAVAHATNNTAGHSCNDVLSAESALMVKEHFIEEFGVPIYTASTGGSGGAYSSEQIADAFPGLFDGILVSAVFPDSLSIGLSGVLGFIGVKLIMEALRENELPFLNGGRHITWIPDIPIWLSLVVIVGTLAVTAVASLAKTRRDERVPVA